MPPVNLSAIELHSGDDRPDGYDAPHGDIGPAIGAEHLGGSIIEIPPGQRSWPYHWEAAQEEWLIVLGGTPTVRTADERVALEPGDVVCFPAGPDGAHQVLNESSETCRVVMLSNREPVNVVVYPDSGKVGIRTPWQGGNFPQDAAVGYWEGE